LGKEVEVPEATGAARVTPGELRPFEEDEWAVDRLADSGQQRPRDEVGRLRRALFARELDRKLSTARVPPACRERAEPVLHHLVDGHRVDQAVDRIPWCLLGLRLVHGEVGLGWTAQGTWSDAHGA